MSGQPIVSSLPIPAVERPSDRVAALFDAHYHRLYRLARRLTNSTDDGLDLVQETFLRVAQAPEAVPLGARSEEAWLVRVLVNLRRDQWRKAAVRTRLTTLPSQPATADHGAEVIARAMVWRALELLPPRRRAVIVMRELEGLDVSTIASQLGISAITVRWHLSAGRRDLARVLAAQCGAAQ